MSLSRHWVYRNWSILCWALLYVQTSRLSIIRDSSVVSFQGRQDTNVVTIHRSIVKIMWKTYKALGVMGTLPVQSAARVAISAPPMADAASIRAASPNWSRTCCDALWIAFKSKGRRPAALPSVVRSRSRHAWDLHVCASETILHFAMMDVWASGGQY